MSDQIDKLLQEYRTVMSKQIKVAARKEKLHTEFEALRKRSQEIWSEINNQIRKEAHPEPVKVDEPKGRAY